MLPFLVTVPLRALMPFSGIAKENLSTYFRVSEAVSEIHQAKMSDVLSRLQ